MLRYCIHKVTKIISVQRVSKSSFQKWIDYGVSHILNYYFVYYSHSGPVTYYDCNSVSPGPYDIFTLLGEDNYYYLYMKATGPQCDDVKIKIANRGNLHFEYLDQYIVWLSGHRYSAEAFLFYLAYEDYFLYILLLGVTLDGPHYYTRLAVPILFYKRNVISYLVLSTQDHTIENTNEKIFVTIARLVTYYMLECILKRDNSKYSKNASSSEIMSYSFDLSYWYVSSSQDSFQKTKEKIEKWVIEKLEKRKMGEEYSPAMLLNKELPIISFCQNLETGLTAVYLYHKNTLHTLIGYFDKLNRSELPQEDAFIKKNKPIVSGLHTSYVTIPVDKTAFRTIFCHIIRTLQNEDSKIVSFINMGTNLTHVLSYRINKLDNRLFISLVSHETFESKHEFKDFAEILNVYEVLWYNIIHNTYPNKLQEIMQFVRLVDRYASSVYTHNNAILYFTSREQMNSILIYLGDYKFMVLNIPENERGELYDVLSRKHFGYGKPIVLLYDDKYALIFVTYANHRMSFYVFQDGMLIKKGSSYYEFGERVYEKLVDHEDDCIAFLVSDGNVCKQLTILDVKGTLYAFPLSRQHTSITRVYLNKYCNFYVVYIEDYAHDYYIMSKNQNGQLILNKVILLHKIELDNNNSGNEHIYIYRKLHGQSMLLINTKIKKCHEMKSFSITNEKDIKVFDNKIILPLSSNKPEYSSTIMYDTDKGEFYILVKPNDIYVKA